MCRSEHPPYSVLQHSSHQIFKPETTMPLFLGRDSKQRLEGETATVQQSAVLRAWQRLRWLAKSSRALCNLLTLSELSQTSLPLWSPDLLEFMKRRRRNASQSKQLSNNLLFLQPPPSSPPFLTVEIRRCSN